MEILDGLILLTPAVLSLGLLVWLAYRGVSVLILSPLLAGLAALLVGDPVMATWTQRFMPATGGFVISFFPLFMLGAVFGRVMEVSGAARTIADAVIKALGAGRAILAVVMACAILTYGGISLFVVAFAVYPIALALFSAARISLTLIPASIALGAFTFTMTALPGTPAIQNAIPMPYFGTTVFAAPGLGTIAALIMVLGGLSYLSRTSVALGADTAVGLADDIASEIGKEEPGGPALWVSVTPLIVVIVANLALSTLYFPNLDLAFLADDSWGETSPQAVTGTWSLIASLLIALLVLVALVYSRLEAPLVTMGEGAQMSLVPLFNTAALVGFGAVIAGLPAFAVITGILEGLPGGVVVNLALSTGLLAGITGSASGGMSIALDVLGEKYATLAVQQNIDPGLMHRVTSLATGSLDALPHNGAVITLLGIGKLTHAQAYGPIFVVAVGIPFLAAVAVVVLSMLFGSF
ncbi:MAG: GntP family permease [Pseudomonadota bacterium]